MENHENSMAIVETLPGFEAEISFEKVTDAIYKSELLPKDARDAIIDYIKDSFNENLWNTIENLIEILPDMPANLTQYLDVIEFILKSLIT